FIASRLQDFFGMREAPRIAGGRVGLVVHLLAPNQRAVQVTADLGGFWARHYPDLRRELMRRYPRHARPGDPTSPPGPPGTPPPANVACPRAKEASRRRCPARYKPCESMKATELLRRDHRYLEHLLEIYRIAPRRPAAAKVSLFELVDRVLSLHEAIEDQRFF